MRRTKLLIHPTAIITCMIAAVLSVDRGAKDVKVPVDE